MIRARDAGSMQKLDMATYRQLVGTRLLIATAVVVLVAFLSQIIGPEKSKGWAMKILEMWLWFMSGVLGFGVGAYGLQRFSSKEYLGAKPQPPAPPASPVSIDTQGGDANVQAPVTTDRAALRPSTVQRAVEEAVGRAIEP